VAACLLARGGLEAIQTVEDIGSVVDVARRALGTLHARLPRRAILEGDRQLLRIIDEVPLDQIALGGHQRKTLVGTDVGGPDLAVIHDRAVLG